MMRSFFTSSRNRSLLLLFFSCLSILVFLGRGIYLVVDGLVGIGDQNLDWIGLGPAMMDAGSMFICTALLLPLLVGSIRQLRGGKLPILSIPVLKRPIIWLLLTAWIAMVAIVSALTFLMDFGWLLSAVFFFPALLLPVFVMSWMAAGGLYSGSGRRLWAALGLGMAGGTSLALVLEYALLIFILGIGSVAVAFQPGLQEILQDLQAQVQGTKNMEDLLSVLSPYLVKPWVFFLVLFFAAGLGPLIEEAVKPLAVWILGKHLQSPAEGFALGALSGAGFALLEGLMAASGIVSVPYFGIPARFASSLMHITFSGIVGWGIVSALKERHWYRLLGAYLLSTLLHGMWNGSALLAVYGALRFEAQGAANLDIMGILAALVGITMLGVIFTLMLVALPIINRRFQSSQDDIISPLISPVERNVNGLDSKSN